MAAVPATSATASAPRHLSEDIRTSKENWEDAGKKRETGWMPKSEKLRISGMPPGRAGYECSAFLRLRQSVSQG
jgi:hypothetical protein